MQFHAIIVLGQTIFTAEFSYVFLVSLAVLEIKTKLTLHVLTIQAVTRACCENFLEFSKLELIVLNYKGENYSYRVGTIVAIVGARVKRYKSR